MIKEFKFSLLLSSALVLVVPIAEAAPKTGGGTSTTKTTVSTGQASMVHLVTAGTSILNQTETWSYFEETAAASFTNLLDTSVGANGITFVKSGPGCTSDTAFIPISIVPAYPDTSLDMSHPFGSLVSNSKCSFWTGSPLASTTYVIPTGEVITNGKTGSARCTATFYGNFKITPKQASYPAKTAWSLTGTSGDGLASINVNAWFAAESAKATMSGTTVVSKQFSFSLLNSDGTSRVSPITIAASGVDNFGAALPSIDQRIVYTTMNYPADFEFKASEQSSTNGASSLIEYGDARTLLNTDSHTGNNNGGADGSGLAIANLGPEVYMLGPGNYSFTVSGSVKDVNTTATNSFNRNLNVNVIPQGGCGN